MKNEQDSLLFVYISKYKYFLFFYKNLCLIKYIVSL